MNAVMQADQYTINLQGTTIYITHSPCRTCAEMLIRRGIKRVVYREEYRIKEPIELLRRMQVEVVHMPKKEGIQ
jgi:dCMP deaminase